MEIDEDLRDKMQSSLLCRGEYIISSDARLVVPASPTTSLEKREVRGKHKKYYSTTKKSRNSKKGAISRPVSTSFSSVSLISSDEIKPTFNRCRSGVCARCGTDMYNSLIFEVRRVRFTLCKTCRKIMSAKGYIEIDGSLFSQVESSTKNR